MVHTRDEDLTQKVQSVEERCKAYWEEYFPRLKYPSATDFRPERPVDRLKSILWIDSWLGEAHVGDMVVVAKMVPALRHAGMSAFFITNPSFAPLVASKRDVLSAIANNESETRIRRRLRAATHITGWSQLWDIISYSKPHLMKTSVPLLDHDRAMATKLRSDYSSGGKPLIGICWRTSLIGRNPVRNSQLNSWSALLNMDGYNFVSLQYGSPDLVRQELADAKALHGWTIRHDERIDTLGDLPGYAAQIAACDAVVSIDCSTVFLAGGLGTKTFTLLSREPTGRWGTFGRTCPFFSNNTLLRQVSAGEWESPIAEAAAEIQAMSSVYGRPCQIVSAAASMQMPVSLLSSLVARPPRSTDSPAQIA